MVLRALARDCSCFRVLLLASECHTSLTGAGPLVGFTPTTYLIVFMSAMTGLSIAFLLKFTTNMVAVYCSAAAMLVNAVASFYLFSFRPTSLFGIGMLLVVASAITYKRAT